MDVDDDTPDGCKWWRIQYEAYANGRGANITKVESPGYDVLRAAELEHTSALLVYAKDSSDYEGLDSSLPRPLQDFIERDNAHFRAEIEEAKNNRPPPSYNATSFDIMDEDEVRPSIEQRTSMDSTRAEGNVSDADDDIGGDPPGYDQDGFEGHAEFGLGPNMKQNYREQDDGSVHEIKLDEEEEGEDREMEMMEREHPSLIPGYRAALSGWEARDEIVESQDAGVGGSTFVEDAGVR
jgi:hypothetical protein